MKQFKLILLLLLPLALASLGYAENITNQTVLPSLEWQRVALQEKLTTKVKLGLSAIVKSNQYIVNTVVEYTLPEVPDFAGSGAKKPKKVRFTKADPDSQPKDYLVFSKLGIEAPVIAEFKEAKPKKKSPFADLWKYNESLDIFKSISEIKVDIYLSEKLLDSSRKSIDKIIKALDLSLGGVFAKVKIEYVDLSERIKGIDDKKEKTQDEKIKEYLEWASKFSGVIAVVIAMIMLAIIAFILFSKYKKLKENEQPQQPGAMAQAQQEKEDKEKEEEEEDALGAGGGGGGADGEMFEFGYSGIERLRQFIKNNPTEASHLIKKWLRSDDKIAKKSLMAIVQQFENEELQSVFGKLSEKDREDWKNILMTSEPIKQLHDVNEYISKAIVEDMIVPSMIEDEEVAELLLSLSEANAAEFVKNEGNLGAVLLNIMNTKYVSNILRFLNTEEAEKALNTGLKFDKEKLPELLVSMKDKLREYQGGGDINPFVTRITDILPITPPSKEAALFTSLSQSGEKDALKAIATQIFPAHLITTLPEEFLAEILEVYPAKQRVDLIASLPDKVKNQFIDVIAPEGTMAREMMFLELEKFETDAELKVKIETESEEIWDEFVAHARDLIKRDAKYREQVEGVLDTWIDSGQGATTMTQYS